MSHPLFSLNPFLGTSPVPNLESLPSGMKSVVQDIAHESSQDAALLRAYTILGEKYHGSRILTFFRPDRWFIADVEKLWGIRGALHCHHMNYLLRSILVTSGMFTTEVIKAKWTLVWYISPHQYLEITFSDGQKIEVDLWGKRYGVPFGRHAYGFHSGRFFAKIAK